MTQAPRLVCGDLGEDGKMTSSWPPLTGLSHGTMSGVGWIALAEAFFVASPPCRASSVTAVLRLCSQAPSGMRDERTRTSFVSTHA